MTKKVLATRKQEKRQIIVDHITASNHYQLTGNINQYVIQY